MMTGVLIGVIATTWSTLMTSSGIRPVTRNSRPRETRAACFVRTILVVEVVLPVAEDCDLESVSSVLGTAYSPNSRHLFLCHRCGFSSHSHFRWR